MWTWKYEYNGTVNRCGYNSDCPRFLTLLRNWIGQYGRHIGFLCIKSNHKNKNNVKGFIGPILILAKIVLLLNTAVFVLD